MMGMEEINGNATATKQIKTYAGDLFDNFEHKLTQYENNGNLIVGVCYKMQIVMLRSCTLSISLFGLTNVIAFELLALSICNVPGYNCLCFFKFDLQ